MSIGKTRKQGVLTNDSYFIKINVYTRYYFEVNKCAHPNLYRLLHSEFSTLREGHEYSNIQYIVYRYLIKSFPSSFLETVFAVVVI